MKKYLATILISVISTSVLADKVTIYATVCNDVPTTKSLSIQISSLDQPQGYKSATLTKGQPVSLGEVEIDYLAPFGPISKANSLNRFKVEVSENGKPTTFDAKEFTISQFARSAGAPFEVEREYTVTNQRRSAILQSLNPRDAVASNIFPEFLNTIDAGGYQNGSITISYCAYSSYDPVINDMLVTAKIENYEGWKFLCQEQDTKMTYKAACAGSDDGAATE